MQTGGSNYANDIHYFSLKTRMEETKIIRHVSVPHLL